MSPKTSLIAIPLFLMFGGALLSMQEQERREPAFEVASVKPTPPPVGGRGAKGGPGYNDPSLFSVRNRPLRPLILMAYGIEDYQVAGGPAWISEDRFDIDARPASSTTREQMMLMLRTLLADRFQLRLHHETRQLPMNILAVAKGGPKFGPNFHRLGDGELPADGRDAKLDQGLPLGGTIKSFANSLRRNMEMIDPVEGHNVPHQDVAPIVDQTGLEGGYEIRLRVFDSHEDWSALLEHQLGLTLSLRKSRADILVIDSVSKPSGN